MDGQSENTGGVPGRKLGKVVGYAFLVAISVLALTVIIGPQVGIQSEIVISGSMSPAIRAGDMVFAHAVTPTDIQVGDIIMYTALDETTLIMHRVVEVGSGLYSKPQFITQGDANRNPEPNPVAADQVVGIVFFSIPFFGALIRFIKTPVGLILMIGVPLLVLLASELRLCWREGEE